MVHAFKLYKLKHRFKFTSALSSRNSKQNRHPPFVNTLLLYTYNSCFGAVKVDVKVEVHNKLTMVLLLGGAGSGAYISVIIARTTLDGTHSALGTRTKCHLLNNAARRAHTDVSERCERESDVWRALSDARADRARGSGRWGRRWAGPANPSLLPRPAHAAPRPQGRSGRIDRTRSHDQTPFYFGVPRFA